MIPKSGNQFSDKIMRKIDFARCSRLTAARAGPTLTPKLNEKPRRMGGASVHLMRAALAFLALLAWLTWLGTLAGLLPAALLLLARLLTAALLTGLLTGLIALLLLAWLLVWVLVGILILRHSVFLQRCWLLWLEDCLRDFPANNITSHEFFRSVCNGTREL
jgi:hypothetical protein